MDTGRRIDLIKRLARTLSQQSWTDIDLTLRQYSLPTTSGWEPNDRYGYCATMLGGADADTLQDLDTYLHGPSDASPDDAPWRTDDLRVFLSHVSRHKAQAAELKARLEEYSVEAFVAHEDIEPNKEWQRVIEAALRSCDACVALLHREFPASKWGDQEIGFVLCRNLPVVPVHFDRQPYGFLGKIQSLYGIGVSPAVLAPLIVRSLLRDPRTSTALTKRLVHRFVHAPSAESARTLSTVLATDALRITAEQIARLQTAGRTYGHGTSANARHVEANLLAIDRKFGTAPVPTPTRPVPDTTSAAP